jgi:uncharacterized protein (TIGR00251 family)
MLQIGQINGGVRIEVRVQPRSSRNQVVGEQDGTLKVKLTAPPVDGEANATLLDFLSSYLKCQEEQFLSLGGRLHAIN